MKNFKTQIQDPATSVEEQQPLKNNYEVRCAITAEIRSFFGAKEFEPNTSQIRKTTKEWLERQQAYTNKSFETLVNYFHQVVHQKMEADPRAKRVVELCDRLKEEEEEDLSTSE